MAIGNGYLSMGFVLDCGIEKDSVSVEIKKKLWVVGGFWGNEHENVISYL